jgi:hypothetical protein
MNHITSLETSLLQQDGLLENGGTSAGCQKGIHMVVINPGSVNVKIGLETWKTPVVIPHCIAHYMRGPMDEQAQISKRNHKSFNLSGFYFEHSKMTDGKGFIKLRGQSSFEWYFLTIQSM